MAGVITVSSYCVASISDKQLPLGNSPLANDRNNSSQILLDGGGGAYKGGGTNYK